MIPKAFEPLNFGCVCTACMCLGFSKASFMLALSCYFQQLMASKGYDQTEHKCSLIRAFACHISYLWKWICVTRANILAAITSIWTCPPLNSIISSFWRREHRMKAGFVTSSWFPCGHHKGCMAMAVLVGVEVGGLMESLCLVEGVDAIPRPSGALSTVVNLPSFASKNFGDSWDSRTTSQNIVIQATKGDLALTLSSI